MLRIPKHHDHKMPLAVIAGALLLTNGALIAINENIKDQPSVGIVASAQTTREEQDAQKQAEQQQPAQEAEAKKQQEQASVTGTNSQQVATPDSTYVPPAQSGSATVQPLPSVGGRGVGPLPDTTNPQPTSPSQTIPEVCEIPKPVCVNIDLEPSTLPTSPDPVLLPNVDLDPL